MINLCHKNSFPTSNNKTGLEHVSRPGAGQWSHELKTKMSTYKFIRITACTIQWYKRVWWTEGFTFDELNISFLSSPILCERISKLDWGITVWIGFRRLISWLFPEMRHFYFPRIFALSYFSVFSFFYPIGRFDEREVNSF